MKDATLAALKFITGAELEALAARCKLPSLADKLTALAGFPRASALDPHPTPGWLANFAATLADDESAALDALLAPAPAKPAGTA